MITMAPIAKQARRFRLLSRIRQFVDHAFSLVQKYTVKPVDEIIQVLDLSEDDMAPPCDTLHIERINASHWEAILSFVRQPRNYTPSRTRYLQWSMHAGHDGFVAYRGDEMIGYTWFETGAPRETDPHPQIIRLGIELEESDIFSFNLYVDPAHRGGGTSMEFLLKVQASLRDMGIRRIYGNVQKKNLPARVLYRTVGREEQRTVRSYKLFHFFLLGGGRLYSRNRGRGSNAPMDFRPLFGKPTT